jgi:flagellar biogenesis protein FliO
MATAALVNYKQRWRRASQGLAAWIVDRRQAKMLQVRETASLGNRAMLALVEVGGQRLLAGVANGSVTFHSLSCHHLEVEVRGYVR